MKEVNKEVISSIAFLINIFQKGWMDRNMIFRVLVNETTNKRSTEYNKTEHKHGMK